VAAAAAGSRAARSCGRRGWRGRLRADGGCWSPTSPDVWQTRSRWTWRSSTRRATRAPSRPRTPWMAGRTSTILLRQLIGSGLDRLSAVAPDVGYNLAVAAFFALSVVAAFGLAYAIGGPRGDRAVGGRAVHSSRARSAPASSCSTTAGRCASTTGSAPRA
jgi:hypothetical protein